MTVTSLLHRTTPPSTHGRRTETAAWDRAPRGSGDTLSRVLELLERSPLSGTELRILRAVLEGEAAASELATSLDRRPLEIRHAAERLYAHGLLRWWHDHRRDEPVLALTATGLAALRPLLAADDPL